MQACSAETKKCSNCRNTFSVSDWHKLCQPCRDKRSAYAKTPAGKASRKKWDQSPKGKLSHKKNDAKPNAVAYKRKYRKTERGRASIRKYEKSTHGKASRKAIAKRHNSKMINRAGQSMRKMLLGIHPNPVSLVSLGCFKDNDDAHDHFVSTFESWMNMDNYGHHVAGDSYKSKWNIGHRLPKCIFDGQNEDDLRKCWSKDNLYAQCARENEEANSALILTDSELMKLKHCWPSKAFGDIDFLKAMYKRVCIPAGASS